jgi:DNA-binding response OmpR family regulator
MPRILAVDDDPGVRTLVERLLAKNGYEVTSATQGKEAIRLLLGMEQPPDLIISDIMMPEVDGLLFSLWCKSRPGLRLVPFLFLTVLDRDDEALKSHIIGFDDYLAKPFSVQDLLLRVQTVLIRTEPYRRVFGHGSPGYEGTLKEISLASLISTIGVTERTGRLEVRQGADRAEILFDRGSVTGITCPGMAAETALPELLKWQNGWFKIEFGG